MRTCVLACLCLALLAIGFAQETKPAGPPALTDAQHSAMRDAQHKLDAIEKQQKDLDISVQQGLNQASARGAQLQRQWDAAKAALDKAKADITAGVDSKKWQLDDESLSWAVVSPAAPGKPETPSASAPPSTPAPAKPSPPAQAKK